MLAKEKGIPCFEVPLKADLGVAAGLEVSTAAIAVIDLGDGESILKELMSE
jgi:large subunit ribosomal protein L7Ae